MRYLVTGGAGFIGSHIADTLLKSGHDLTVIDDLSTGIQTKFPEGVVFIKGDITDKSLVNSAMKNVDGCFHLAAISSVEICRLNPARGSAVNLGGTVNIFESASKAGIPVVYASSAAVYGNSGKAICSETDEVLPINNYGADKYSCELQAKDFNSGNGLKSVGARIFNCYGPKQRADSEYSGVIAKFINAISQDNPITIYGDGSFSRDFIFVEDVVRFFITAMQNLLSGKVTFEVANVCTGKQVTISQLAQVISEVLGKKLQINYRPARVDDIPVSLGDPLYASQEFGWKYSYELKEGLTKMINC